MEKVARKVFAAVKGMVAGRFETEPATPQSHPHVKWGAYEDARRTVEAEGFRHLDDVDAVSVPHDATIMKRPVLAIFLGPDGTEVAGHYRMPLRWSPAGILARLAGGRGDFFDLGTNFGGPEGVWVSTTNAKGVGQWTAPPFDNQEALSRSTGFARVLERHRERTARFRAAHPDAVPTRVSTLGEIVALADAMERRKLEWRRGTGWATRDELGRVTKLSGSALDRFYQAFQRAAAEDAGW